MEQEPVEVEEPVEEEPPPPVVEIEVQPKRAARKPKTPPSALPSTPAPSEDSPEEERPKPRAKAKAKSEPKAKAEPKTPRVAKAKAAPDQPVAEVNPMAAMVAALHQHKERANDHRRLMYQSFLAGLAQ